MSRTEATSGPAGITALFASTPARASSGDSSHSGGAPAAAFPSRICCACGCTEAATAYLRELTVAIEVRQYRDQDSGHGAPQRKPLISRRRHRVALGPVRPAAAHVGGEHPRLAGDVRADVPGVRLREQRRVRHLGHVRHPRVLGRGDRLDRRVAVRPQPDDAVPDPLHVLLDGQHHVAEHRRRPRPGDDEHVREPGRGHPEVGARARPTTRPAARPRRRRGCRSRTAPRSARRTRSRTRARRARRSGRGLHAARVDRLDRRRPDVDQRHVRPVEHRVVVVALAQPLRPDRVARGQSSSATAGSVTVSLIRSRMNSAMTSLASCDTSRSVYAPRNGMPPPARHRSAERPLHVLGRLVSTGRPVPVIGTPRNDSRASSRYSR